MKIVVLATHFVKGGAERQLSMVAEALARCGHNVVQVSIAEQELPKQAGIPGLTRRSLGIRRFRSLALFWRTFACLWRERPQVVLSCVTACDFLAMLWCKLSGTPWVMREPSSYAGGTRKEDVKLRRFLGRAADLVIANNEEGFRHWQRIRKAKPTAWILNLMDTQALRSSAEQAPGIALPKKPFLVAVGRLESVKNFTQVIQAFAKVAQENGDASLVFVGDGSLRGELETEAKALGIADRVLFCGFVPNPLPVVKAARGLVLSSVYEGCPNAALEAYIVGTPVLLSDIPPHRAIFSEADARFFPVDDVDATAKVLTKCLHDSDPGVFREELIANWSAEGNGRRLDALLSKLVS